MGHGAVGGFAVSAASTGPVRRVESHLGTVVSLAAAGVHRADIDQFFERIRDLEALFSRFRPDSQISRLGAGRLHPDDAAPEVREVLGRCEHLRELTGGAFDHWPARSGGPPERAALDTDAVAKGWIVDEATTGLRLAGGDFMVNGGGDVIVTRPPGESVRRVGIQDPADPRSVFAVLSLSRGSVATSGTYQQGRHVRMVRRDTLASVTVVGPDLGWADGLATAVLADGRVRPSWWAAVDPSYGLLVLDVDRRRHWFPPGDTLGEGGLDPRGGPWPIRG